jgi:type IV pilus biogenesis protein CpaD/CtpE
MKVKCMRACYVSRTSLTIAMAMGACSHTPSTVDDNFGFSVRQLVKTQIANPHAPTNTTSPAPSDGQSAKSAIDRYQQSFDSIPLPTNVFNIGVGSGTGGGTR